MGSGAGVSAFWTPGSCGGLGTTASQTASRGRPSAPNTKKRPRQPSVASSRGDRNSPTRLPAIPNHCNCKVMNSIQGGLLECKERVEYGGRMCGGRMGGGGGG